MAMEIFNTNKKYTDDDMLLWVLHPSKSDTIEYPQVSKFSQEFNDAMGDAMAKRINDPNDEALIFISALRSTPGYPTIDIETFLNDKIIRVLLCQLLDNMYESSVALQKLVITTRYLVRVNVSLPEEANCDIEYFIYCRNDDEFHMMQEKVSSKEFQDVLNDGVKKCTCDYENNKYALRYASSLTEQSATTYRLNHIDDAICKLTGLPFSRRLKIVDYEKLLDTYDKYPNKQVYINMKTGEYDFRLDLYDIFPRKSNIYSDSHTHDDIISREDSIKWNSTL